MTSPRPVSAASTPTTRCSEVSGRSSTDAAERRSATTRDPIDDGRRSDRAARVTPSILPATPPAPSVPQFGASTSQRDAALSDAGSDRRSAGRPPTAGGAGSRSQGPVGPRFRPARPPRPPRGPGSRRPDALGRRANRAVPRRTPTNTDEHRRTTPLGTKETAGHGPRAGSLCLTGLSVANAGSAVLLVLGLVQGRGGDDPGPLRLAGPRSG